MKLFQLKTKRLLKNSFKGIGFNLSIIFLLFSVAVSLMLIIPNCFDRLPVYSYFVKKMELPITYEVTGKIEFYDVDGNNLDLRAMIFVGGYSCNLETDGSYKLTFSCPSTSDAYLVIRYNDQTGKEQLKTECLKLSQQTHLLEEDFKYYV
jgi:hypothetical protein